MYYTVLNTLTAIKNVLVLSIHCIKNEECKKVRTIDRPVQTNLTLKYFIWYDVLKTSKRKMNSKNVRSLILALWSSCLFNVHIT